MRTIFAILSLALASLIPLPVAADAVPIQFSARQRELIVAFARDQARTEIAAAEATRSGDRYAAKPGHDAGKHQRLPPGIAKNLARGKPVPPGIAMTRLPLKLARTLPPVPKGHEIVVVDGRVLLIDAATRRIRDKLEGVFLR